MTATIVVADAPESYESVDVTTFAGIYPELPGQGECCIRHWTYHGAGGCMDPN